MNINYNNYILLLIHERTYEQLLYHIYLIKYKIKFLLIIINAIAMISFNDYNNKIMMFICFIIVTSVIVFLNFIKIKFFNYIKKYYTNLLMKARIELYTVARKINF